MGLADTHHKVYEHMKTDVTAQENATSAIGNNKGSTLSLLADEAACKTVAATGLLKGT